MAFKEQIYKTRGLGFAFHLNSLWENRFAFSADWVCSHTLYIDRDYHSHFMKPHSKIALSLRRFSNQSAVKYFTKFGASIYKCRIVFNELFFSLHSRSLSNNSASRNGFWSIFWRFSSICLNQPGWEFQNLIAKCSDWLVSLFKNARQWL